MVYKITKVALISLTVFFLGGCIKHDPQKELRIFTWSEYLRADVIEDFEKETGIKIKADYFSSNEQLLAKVQLSVGSKERGYDLILPSDYMVKNMIELKLLQKLDKSKFSFLKDFAPEFLHPSYDQNLDYSIPMALGTTGMAINTKLAGDLNWKKGLSWKEVFENQKLAGKITLLDDVKEALNVGLLALGKRWDAANEVDIKAAFAFLKKNKKMIRVFTSETRPVIEADECVVCQAYSGDAITSSKTKPEIVFTLPKDGSSRWADNFAIPVNAAQINNAYLFINKLLDAEQAAKFTQKVFYPTANEKAKQFLPADIVSNTSIYTPKEMLPKLLYLTDKPKLMLMIDREWTELKSQ